MIQTNNNNLCIECGICVAICPVKAITLKKENYNYLPNINEECINCGLCKKVCPMNNLCDNYNPQNTIKKSILGNYQKIYSAKTFDKEILKNATSGGMVTQLIKCLLQENIYDKAFLLDGYSYDEQLKTIEYDKRSDLTKSQKSRYLTISHENTCRYMLKNPSSKVIVVGTGCAINGIKNFIKIKKLDINNYLFLGLICDKTMHYGVWDYFSGFLKKQKIKELYFRIKENGGWPGNVRILSDNEEIMDLDRRKRMNVKDYFVPECCLYCLNKLNTNADIVLGDNYIKRFEDKAGCSVVLTRSKLGDEIFNKFKNYFTIIETEEEEFLNSLHLEEKEKNISNAIIKGLIKGRVTKKNIKTYKESLRKIKIGKQKDLYTSVNRDIWITKLKKKLVKNIFSITNEKYNDKLYKTITFIGIKFKFQK